MNQYVLVGAGIVLIVVTLEAAPKVGALLLALVVITMLVNINRGSKV